MSLNCTLIFAQINTNENLTPGGVLDNVFDKDGNKYRLSDILVVKPNATVANRSVQVICNPSSIFNLYFEPGCGMYSTTITEEINRRTVLCQVFKDISDFLTTSTSPIIVNNNKVNIWVRNINNLQNVPPNPLGLATSFSVAPSHPTLGGIVDNEIWKTIRTGKDSFINTSAPLSSNAPINNTAGSYYHGMVSFNFNVTGSAPNVSWYTTPLNAVAPNNTYDFYSVVLHEVIHALGFSSLLNQYGTSVFGTNFKYFSRYDQFLKNNAANAQLIVNTATIATSSMYKFSFNPALSPTVLRPNCPNTSTFDTSTFTNSTICGNALKFSASTTMPIYTPTCFEKSLSYSHFEDLCVAPNVNDAYFLMSNVQLNSSPNNTKRYLKPEERRVLCDLGYYVNQTFGNASTRLTATQLGPFAYTGGSCAGISVAGTNDGINPTTFGYTFTGEINTNIPINISAILANDTSPTGNPADLSIEFLQDLTTNSMLLPTGTNATIYNLNTSTSGLHLLRYVPTYNGQKGNITYVYVFVTKFASNCVQPTTCNLVANGDFEQNSSLPNDYSQIINACGWYPANLATPDYYVQGAVTTNPTYPLIGVPCNSLGYENDLFVNNVPSKRSYAGTGIADLGGGSLYTEAFLTKLTTPLIANTPYQLSFDVSLAEKYSTSSIKIQAYFSSSNISSLNLGEVTVTNPTLLFTNPTFSTISDGWEHIVFNIPPQTINSINYLCIGGINGIVLQSKPQGTTNPANCPIIYDNTNPAAYYYVDNVNLVVAGFDLPASFCQATAITNLAIYLSPGTISTGVFSGPGVTLNQATGLYSFQFPTGVNSATITYSYTNNLGCNIILQDTITATNVVTLTPPIIPNICQGAVAPILPTTLNGITGTWNPAVISNTASGNYTFTPSAGQCANAVTVAVQVRATVTPTPPTIPIICQGGTVPVLQTTLNGITGTWNPSIISNTLSGNYTFTPTAGQCANPVSVAAQVLSNNAFVANADAFPVTFTTGTAPIATNSVLLNDTYNGSPVPSSIPGVPYTIVLTGTPPVIPLGGITFNASTGVFTVQSNTTPGTYVYQYYLQNNCYQSPIRSIKIVVSKVTNAGRMAFAFCFNNNGATSSTTTTYVNGPTTLYSGTIINGQPASSTTSSIVMVPLNQTLPSALTLNANGSFTVAPGTLPGAISFNYKICSNTSACTDTITCVIDISSTLFINQDFITATNASSGGLVNYNVLSNDRYKGTCSSTGIVPATLSNVFISTANPPVNNLPYYSINPTTGQINNLNPNIITAGTHLMAYTICDVLYPTICATTNVLITVPTPRLKNLVENSIFDIEKTSVAPNPNNGKFTIFFNSITDDIAIELFTIVGQKIYEKNFLNVDKVNLAIDGVSSGNYILRISNKSQSISKKIIFE